MADIALKVESLEHWRDGNGKKGAAAMILDHEEKLTREISRNDCQDEALRGVALADAVAKATERQMFKEVVEEVLKARSRTFEGIIRALGPWFAALCAFLGPIILYQISQGGK
ncbi:MAG: hypothetical protein WC455_24945 [Dehalococcoidia bacterium]|jgi:hypothetical protein